MVETISAKPNSTSWCFIQQPNLLVNPPLATLILQYTVLYSVHIGRTLLKTHVQIPNFEIRGDFFFCTKSDLLYNCIIYQQIF